MLKIEGSIVLSVHPDNYTPNLYDLYTQGVELIGIPEELNVKRGWGYDRTNNIFYPPKPHESWVLSNGEWQAPIAMPTNHNDYYWDEAGQQWRDAKLEKAYTAFEQSLRDGVAITHTGNVQVGAGIEAVTEQTYHIQARKDPDLINIGNVLGRVYRMADHTQLFSWRVKENVRPIKPLSEWVVILENVQNYYEAAIAAYHVIKDQIQSDSPPIDEVASYQTELSNKLTGG